MMEQSNQSVLWQKKGKIWLWIFGGILSFFLLWWLNRNYPSETLRHHIENVSPDYRVLFLAHASKSGELIVESDPLGPWDVPSWLPDGSGLVAWVPKKEQLIIADKEGQQVTPLLIDGEECHLSPEKRNHTCIDPAIIEISEGIWRLYYVYAELTNDPVTDPLEEEIRSAISHDAGATWLREPKARLSGASLADPDPIILPNGHIRLYYSTDLDESGRNIPLIRSAYSEDGLSFQQEKGNRVEWASASSALQGKNGKTDMYIHTLDSTIQLYHSEDGLQFTRDESSSLVLSVPDGYLGAEAPSVYIDDDHLIHILFSSIDEPYFPFNILLGMTAEEESKNRLLNSIP